MEDTERSGELVIRQNPLQVTEGSIRWRILKELSEAVGAPCVVKVTEGSIRWRILKEIPAAVIHLLDDVTEGSIRWRILKGHPLHLLPPRPARHRGFDPMEDTESAFLVILRSFPAKSQRVRSDGGC